MPQRLGDPRILEQLCRFERRSLARLPFQKPYGLLLAHKAMLSYLHSVDGI